MHLYKNFFKMISKYKSGLIIYGCIFAVMIIVLLANGLPQVSRSGEDENANIADDSYTIGYIDNSDSALSKALIEYLDENNDMVDMSDKTEDNVKTMVFFAAVSASITIDEDFENKVIAGDDTAVTYLADAGDGPSVYLIENMINNYLKTYVTYLDMGFAPEDAITKTKDNLELNAKASVYIAEGSDASAADHKFDFVVGTACKFFIYISFSALTLCIGGVLVKSNTGKVAERIKAAPVKPGMISLVNTAGLIICGFILWVIMGIVILLMGSSSAMVKEHSVPLFAILLASVICNCAMASFISSFNVSENVMPMVVNIAGLGLSFISGVFVPQCLMDPKVLAISKFMPFYWGVRVIDSICPGSGSDLEYTPRVLLVSVGVILLCAVVFALAGMLVRKNRTV